MINATYDEIRCLDGPQSIMRVAKSEPGYYGYQLAHPAGTAYGLYLSNKTNVDYGIYVVGNAVNYFAGNVGVGTTTPDFKLDVKGTIRAEEVKVETGWSNYVFEKDYNLRSLDEVETHIQQHKHLPDIPSAKEIEKNGLYMAAMMTKQMQKIEELTLYVIEQNKKIDKVIEENKQLKEKVYQLTKVKH